MPVFFNDTRRVLYIHTPKTGGTSIEFFFERNGFRTHYLDRGGAPDSLNPVRRASPQHMHAAALTTLFDIRKFDAVFMTVRHPLARLASQYRMESNTGAAKAPFQDWILQELAGAMGDPCYKDNHLRPQSDFWVEGAAIMRLEDGLGGKFVCALEQKLGLTFADRTIGRDMVAHGPAPDFAALPCGVANLARAYYRNDFTLFGYNDRI